jgi:inorganic pyrophosphatase
MMPLTELAAWVDRDTVFVVTETTRGSGSKFKYDPELGLFRISHVLPVGATFPYDFGFVPSTLGEDGDPLDVLILMDSDSFPGCVAAARLIGVIDATQKEPGKRRAKPNSRLIGIEKHCATWANVSDLRELPKGLLDQIEHFFISYTERRGIEFRPRGRRGPAQARREVEAGAARFRRPGRSAEAA